MNIVYLHGLDSDPNAIKSIITRAACQARSVGVFSPDLNCPPDVVLDKVRALITPETVLIGSSLGGYFANLISDLSGVPAVLLNPSIRPDLSFRRFLDEQSLDNLNDDDIIYTTTGGWQIKYGDLAWFENHRLTVKYPNRLTVLLKMGDELLDAYKSREFYHTKNVTVHAQDGGDHRISDYELLVDDVIDWADKLLKAD